MILTSFCPADNKRKKHQKSIERDKAMTLQEQYLIDREGNRLGVVLDMKQFQSILEDLEELDDIRSFDAAIASKDEAILFTQAVAEIERKRLYRIHNTSRSKRTRGLAPR